MKLSSPRYSSAGFTLVELIVVITLISIVSAIFITLINPLEQIAKARDAERKTDLSQIQAALEFYRSDNSTYPPTSSYPSTCDAPLTGSGTTYLKKTPCDPSTGNKYQYSTQNANSTYLLWTCLENKKDKAGQSGNSNCGEKLYYAVQNP